VWGGGGGCVSNLKGGDEIKKYGTIILPVHLYGCETWSLTLREEHRLTVSGNRVLRRIFRPKRDDVTGGWRRLHNEQLHNLYASSNVIRVIKLRRMRWEGNVASMRERKNVYNIPVGKLKAKRPLGRANEPSGSIKGGNFLTSSMTVSFLRMTLLRGVQWYKILILCPEKTQVMIICNSRDFTHTHTQRWIISSLTI
jgi:hypothetical protein